MLFKMSGKNSWKNLIVSTVTVAMLTLFGCTDTSQEAEEDMGDLDKMTMSSSSELETDITEVVEDTTAVAEDTVKDADAIAEPSTEESKPSEEAVESTEATDEKVTEPEAKTDDSSTTDDEDDDDEDDDDE